MFRDGAKNALHFWDSAPVSLQGLGRGGKGQGRERGERLLAKFTSPFSARRGSFVKHNSLREAL